MSDPVTVQRVLTISALLDDGPIPVKEIVRATQINDRHVDSLLTAAGNLGLLTWQDKGKVGSINSRSWRDQYLAREAT